MSTYPAKENSKTPLIFSVMIALAALLMIYWVLNTANVFSTPISLSHLPIPAAQVELLSPAERPDPLPVPPHLQRTARLQPGRWQHRQLHSSRRPSPSPPLPPRSR